MAITLFLVAYVALDMVHPVPLIVTGIYLAVSAITFATYAYDKHQARTGGWRVSEATLLLQGLLGGWPGAIIAQLVFNHKTIKSSFRAAFWASVVVNVLVFAAMTIAVEWGS